MRKKLVWVLVSGIVAGGARSARSQEPPPPVAPSLPGEEGELGAGLQEQIDELRRQMRQKEEDQRQSAPRLTTNGYVDFGFFVPNGNGGVGWLRDVGNLQLPEYQGFAWTFLGDILATTINTRGEAADMGDAPGIDRFDSVDSGGAAGFIVNEMNLRLGYQLADSAIMRTSVNFVPRSARQDFALGDFLDVDQAELEYVVTSDGNTSIFVGKTMPVFGIEYKERKSDQRFGITPSLMHRYTAGPQLGLKARSKLFNEWLILAGAVTNNSSVTEQFHFYREIDSNNGKTLSGRLAVSVPIGSFIGALAGDKLELGLSGEWGPQDVATDNEGALSFVGLDLQYIGANFALKAQVMRGEAPGDESGRVWKLDLRESGYVEVNWQFLPFIGILARAELRDALVTLGMDRAYVTNELRVTGGLRFVFNRNIVVKAEYLHNREQGGIRQFDNDVFTSSLVMAF
jgi:hypothetical protein